MYEFRNFDRLMCDYFGAPIPRPIRIGRFSSSLEKHVYDSDPGHGFLRAMGRAARLADNRIRRVFVELIQEGLFQWIFKVTVRTRETKRVMCMVVAKDGHKFSRTGSREYELLKELHKRNPQKVAATLGSSEVVVSTGKRESRLFVYWTGWLYGYWELGLTEQHRFALIGAHDVRLLGPKQADRVRCDMLEILASLFEPKTGSALVDVQVNSGDFMVSLEPDRPLVRLIAARHLKSGLSGAGLLRNLLSAKGEQGNKPVFLYPGKVSAVVASLTAGLTHAFSDEKAGRDFLVQALHKLVTKGADAPSESFGWSDLLDSAQSGPKK